ncbi:MAG: UDP-3-O-(3-hydroxymyristoyl)glucosamine N-acyltransferase [Burkholderiaceae bacterium]
MAQLLSAIVAALGGELRGEDCFVERLSPVETATQGALAFISNAKFGKHIATTQASALLVGPGLADAAAARGPCIVVPDVYHHFAKLTQFWRAVHAKVSSPSIHPTAVIDPTAFVAADATVGPMAYVGPGAVVGSQTCLGSHVVLEAGAQLGANCLVHSRVTLGRDCVVGDRCIFHPGVVVGADGFGFAPHGGAWVKIEQLGAVRIGNDVELGANTCVDRGALDDTVIEDGVKLDNLVQIGHNVHIGAHTAMAGCAGVAGSAIIGKHCTVGGGAVVLGHLSLADHVHISAASVVTRSIRQAGQYSGVFPIDDNAAWEKNAATLKQLHALRDRIKKLENT